MVFGLTGNREFLGSGRPAPPFGRVFPAAGAAQTPQVDEFRSVQKLCINPKTIVCIGPPKTPPARHRSPGLVPNRVFHGKEGDQMNNLGLIT